MKALVRKTAIDQPQECPTHQLSTEQFARNNQVKPTSVHHRVCLTGSYFGIVPKRLKNGRLAWPNAQVEA